jgi:hypothetical protein
MTCIYHLSKSIKRTYELLLVYLGERASGKEILSKKAGGLYFLHSNLISFHLSCSDRKTQKKKKKFSGKITQRSLPSPLYLA